MRFFTYGRKSVYRDNSDSIDNQFRMCREYCEARFPGQIESWTQFSDEDFTGANTRRPDFQRMMTQIRGGMCDVLVVYQLDRFSRSVKDFSAAYDDLQAHHVRFICLDLNIDTSTPIGEAMMYVSAAFGQMERQNIALRVSDNLTGLARKGLWVAGNPPVGYLRSQIIIDGRKHSTIIPDPEGVEYIHWLFDYFLNGSFSLQRMETSFRKNGILTRKGTFFSASQIYQLLTSPYCCEATPEVYDYYAGKGCQMATPREQWDGSCGVMIYGRSSEKNKTHRTLPPECWIVCTGIHKPFMPADKWLAAQALLKKNSFCRKKKYDVTLLHGILRCSCGSMMAVARKKRTDGSVYSAYLCLRRLRRGAEACSRAQISADLLDQKALDVFREIDADPDAINRYVSSDNSVLPDPGKIQRKIAACEEKIGRLAASLALAENSSASRYIIAEMESLDAELNELKAQRSDAEILKKSCDLQKRDTMAKVTEIKRLIHNMDGFSAAEKNEIVKSVIRQCTWDGETLFIML